jgi:hypothetical protein
MFEGALDCTLERREEGLCKLFLVLEIAVEATLGHSPRLDDFVHGYAFDPAGEKELESGVAECLNALESILVALTSRLARALGGNSGWKERTASTSSLRVACHGLDFPFLST